MVFFDVNTAREELAKISEGALLSVTWIGGGRNSRVFRFQDETGSKIAKFYYPGEGEARDRMASEYQGLRFLWDHGVRNIPEPLRMDKASRILVFSDIGGEKMADSDRSMVAIDSMIQFLLRLKNLTDTNDCRSLGFASESCVSLKAYEEIIALRLTRFYREMEKPLTGDSLKRFIMDAFLPGFKTISAWCRNETERAGLDWHETVPETCLTLSPSDFGFHNALKGEEGQIFFVDFEYFGWDDPAKMMADFMLHPANRLTCDQRRYFFETLSGHFKKDPDISARVRIVYPLTGLKWCLILLNEFLEDHLSRRAHAFGGKLDSEDLRRRQMEKALAMLAHTMSGYENDTYF